MSKTRKSKDTAGPVNDYKADAEAIVRTYKAAGHPIGLNIDPAATETALATLAAEHEGKYSFQRNYQSVHVNGKSVPVFRLEVVTAPVVFKRKWGTVDLGAFKIALTGKDYYNSGNDYPDTPINIRVIALTPRYPRVGFDDGNNKDVTHPHVKYEALCMGTAGPGIRTSLIAGRLVEAVTLIEDVLRRYNPENPYVRLEQWGDITKIPSRCTDCDRLGTRLKCAGCKARRCHLCQIRCSGCQRVRRCRTCARTQFTKKTHTNNSKYPWNRFTVVKHFCPTCDRKQKVSLPSIVTVTYT